jgi:hypothetical protein
MILNGLVATGEQGIIFKLLCLFVLGVKKWKTVTIK